jgi:SAM-dependent methyltransferase
MHAEALAWVAAHVPADPGDVLDVGGADINGSPRRLFWQARSYTVLDRRAAPGVDLVADATLWWPAQRRWDTVVCCEVLEHVGDWPAVVATCWAALRPGGLLILTAAAPGRPGHSGLVEGPLLAGEHYAGIPADKLERVLSWVGFVDVQVDEQPAPADVRAVARKGR